MFQLKTRHRQWVLAYAFLLPTLLILAVFNFYPMIQAFVLSLFDYSLIGNRREFIGLGNFRRLVHDPQFWLALRNSLLYLLVVPVIVVLSVALALLVEPRIPFINFFRACYYVPVVTMMVVVAFAWKLIFNTDYGAINQVLRAMGVISEGIPWLTSGRMALFTVMTVTIWKGLGYYMVMFIVGLKAVPRELIEAARIDGAGPAQVLLNVKLPALWPTVTLVSILSSISALQVFEEIYVMTSGRLNTITLVYMMYESGLSLDAGALKMGYACAVGVVLFVMLFAFTFFSVRSMGKIYST
ncbi:MAG: sugar ABC transporter permease [Candidatus Sumerlaeia bacterium]